MIQHLPAPKDLHRQAATSLSDEGRIKIVESFEKKQIPTLRGITNPAQRILVDVSTIIIL